MNQVVRIVSSILIVFTWLPSDNKVYVKYFVSGGFGQISEITDYDVMTSYQKQLVNHCVDAFFESPESFNLIKWSY